MSSLKINDPDFRIVRDDTIFNFSDLVEKFAVVEDTVIGEEGKLNVRNIRVNDGVVHYSEKKFPLT